MKIGQPLVKNNWILNTTLLIILTCVVGGVKSESTKQFKPIPVNIKQMLFQGNYIKAATHLRLLANKGQSVAQYQLALLYLAGNGVSISETKATSLLTRSANSYPKSAYLLATLLLKKEQTSANRKRVIKYLQTASHAGNKQAEKKLNEINSKVSGNQFRPQTQALFELALSSGELQLVIKQFLRGANLNRKNIYGDAPIATAIKHKNNDIVRWLLKQTINLNSRDRLKNTPLHLLSKSGNLALIIELSKKTTSLDSVNRNGDTPIITSLLNGHYRIAQWLLDNGANPRIKNRNNLSAVSYAKTNNIVLKKRLGKSKNKNNELKKSKQKQQQAYSLKQLNLLASQKTSSYYQWPQLHIAAAQQQLAITDILLSQNHSPWELNPNKQTVIEIAIEKQNIKLLQKLLKNSPITSQKERDKLNSLLLFLVTQVATVQSRELIRSIVKQAASLNMMSIVNDALLVAIRTKNSDSTTQLLSINMIRIDKSQFLESIPFATAEMMKKLLTKDVDLSWSNEEGKSVLIIATQNKNVQLLDYLLSKNIDVEHSDKQGLTALMWSIKQDCIQCLSSLLKSEASTESISKTGNSPLMIASYNNAESLEILLSHPYELSHRNQYSLTALMIAVKSGCLKCAKLLLDAGANPRRKNKTGQDSHDLAYTNKKITELLDQY
ncbi:MAG: hypothetical protein COA86_10865 [Kangiella sp.]|nr:MAG: hypothetical protein COA86_10865 [Kangiella sp.]